MPPNKIPSVLAESWMPIDQIGAECMRDASAAQKPPLNRLHVWWARRPLTISRAAILGSLLPQWSGDWPKELRKKFPNEETYHQWFLELLGILGDPAAGRKLLQLAAVQGKFIANPYGYPRAYTKNPSQEQLETLASLLRHAWGSEDLSVCDPMSGGGSIPFEALRYGFRTYANELNPVASVILKATLDYPGRLGPGLVGDIRYWGDTLYRRVTERLKPFFSPLPQEAVGACYIWARTVACPTTGKPVPLSPNWWLQKGAIPIAVEVIADPNRDLCEFRILRGDDVTTINPDEGTVKRGVGRSPWTGDAIDGDYIKREAQQGRMGQQLYAVATKTKKGFVFRPPTEQDLAAVVAAEEELKKRLPVWEAQGIVPSDTIPVGNKTSEPLRYGMQQWKDMFSPRQLLSLLTFVEELRALGPEIEDAIAREARSKEMSQEEARAFAKLKAEAVKVYLGIAIDKGCDYNSRLDKWDGTRNKITNTFDRHDFSFKWSFAEFDAAGNMGSFIISQVSNAYQGIANLVFTPESRREA